jgi:hypothetical protein
MSIDPALVELLALGNAQGVKPLTFSQAGDLVPQPFDYQDAYGDTIQGPLDDLFGGGNLLSQMKAQETNPEAYANFVNLRSNMLKRVGSIRSRLFAGENPQTLLAEWRNTSSGWATDDPAKGGMTQAGVAAIEQGLQDYAAREAQAEAESAQGLQNLVTYLIARGVDPTPALENASRQQNAAEAQAAAELHRAQWGPIVDNPIMRQIAARQG